MIDRCGGCCRRSRTLRQAVESKAANLWRDLPPTGEAQISLIPFPFPAPPRGGAVVRQSGSWASSPIGQALGAGQCLGPLELCEQRFRFPAQAGSRRQFASIRSRDSSKTTSSSQYATELMCILGDIEAPSSVSARLSRPVGPAARPMEKAERNIFRRRRSNFPVRCALGDIGGVCRAPGVRRWQNCEADSVQIAKGELCRFF